MPHHIYLLGRLDIVMSGNAAASPSMYRPRKVALLALLLLSRRPMRRQEIASLLWPQVDDRRARGSLNQLLLELRREYGADAFEMRADDELAIRDGAFECDAVALYRLAADGRHADVAGAYTGQLMPGLYVTGAAEFNEWADEARARLDETVADSAWHAARSASSDDAVTKALSLCAALRPRDEAVLRRRMQHEASMGNVAGAAALYESHRARMMEDLGVPPSAETRKLLIQLCTDTEAGGASIPTAVHATSAAPPKRRLVLQRAALAVACAIVLLVSVLYRASHESGDANRPKINVALINAGNEQVPAIRALPGLVGTYLIRDSAVELSYGKPDDSTYQVVTDIQTHAGEVAGTVQIRKGDALISTTAVRTSTTAGIDTVAAQIARYVADVIVPAEKHTSAAAAIDAAQRHLQFARADYARGARENAFIELARASVQLDSIDGKERNAEWLEVSEAVARERALQTQ